MTIKFDKDSLSLLSSIPFEKGYTPIGQKELMSCSALVAEGSEQEEHLSGLFAALMELIGAVNAIAPIGEDGEPKGVDLDNLFSVKADENGDITGVYGAGISAVESEEGQPKKLCLFIGDHGTDVTVTYTPMGKIYKATIALHDLVGELKYGEEENKATKEKYPRLNWVIPLSSGEELYIPISLSQEVKSVKDFNVAVTAKDVESIIKVRGTGVSGMPLAELGKGTFVVKEILKSGVSETTHDWDPTGGAWYLVGLEDGRAVFINGKDKTNAGMLLFNTSGKFPMPCELKIQEIIPNDKNPKYPRVKATLINTSATTNVLPSNNLFKLPELKSAAPVKELAVAGKQDELPF